MGQVRGVDKPTAISGLNSLPPQPDGQVGLSHARRPQEKDIGAVDQVPARLQFRDEASIQARLEAEVVVLQAAAQGELGHLDPHSGTLLILALHLFSDDEAEEI